MKGTKANISFLKPRAKPFNHEAIGEWGRERELLGLLNPHSPSPSLFHFSLTAACFPPLSLFSKSFFLISMAFFSFNASFSLFHGLSFLCDLFFHGLFSLLLQLSVSASFPLRPFSFPSTASTYIFPFLHMLFHSFTYLNCLTYFPRSCHLHISLVSCLFCFPPLPITRSLLTLTSLNRPSLVPSPSKETKLEAHP